MKFAKLLLVLPVLSMALLSESQSEMRPAQKGPRTPPPTAGWELQVEPKMRQREPGRLAPTIAPEWPLWQRAARTPPRTAVSTTMQGAPRTPPPTSSSKLHGRKKTTPKPRPR